MTVSLVYRFAGFDPFENLAREELWLDTLAPNTSALFLYVNNPCVVLGRHQNPLREVRLDEAFRRGLPVVRRASGGGTVFHDHGNLNWSLVVPKDGYERGAVSAAVAGALMPLGVDLTVGERGDLFLDDKKVSGAAYLVRRDRVMHHGTLLCHTQLEDLHGVLGPTGNLVEWIGVSSRPMPVANLGIPLDQVADSLARAFSEPGLALPPGPGTGDPVFEARVVARGRELRSASWLWDQTPPFTWEGETRAGPLRAVVREGRVEVALERGDTILNLSNIVGISFFSPELFEYIPTREVP